MVVYKAYDIADIVSARDKLSDEQIQNLADFINKGK